MIECWHFIRDDGRMRGGLQAEVGVTYEMNPPINLCLRCYHGSRRILDALNYAPGSLVCRVEIGGDILEDNDKLVGQTRRILWMFDATRVLHLWSCDVAERLLTQRGTTDPRSWDVIRVKREWVDGQRTDAELDAARNASADAVRSAVGDATGDICAAVHAAAQDSAWSAHIAQDAARSAAWAAFHAGGVWAELSQELEERIMRESRS